jgi:aerobic C4-dicarboxylate transport protein
MSECRSLTNFIGNAVATIVVARWERAVDPARLQKAFERGERLEPRALNKNSSAHPE